LAGGSQSWRVPYENDVSGLKLKNKKITKCRIAAEAGASLKLSMKATSA
jgi:hypothetical protein